jgi:hypothetical protein
MRPTRLQAQTNRRQPPTASCSLRSAILQNSTTPFPHIGSKPRLVPPGKRKIKWAKAGEGGPSGRRRARGELIRAKMIRCTRLGPPLGDRDRPRRCAGARPILDSIFFNPESFRGWILSSSLHARPPCLAGLDSRTNFSPVKSGNPHSLLTRPARTDCFLTT